MIRHNLQLKPRQTTSRTRPFDYTHPFSPPKAAHSYRQPREMGQLVECEPGVLQEGFDVFGCSESMLPHEADAIFTELEDELIAVKNQFCRKATLVVKASDKNITAELQAHAQALRGLGRNFKDTVGAFMTRDSGKTGGDRGGTRRSLDRVSIRVSQALIDLAQD